ncbi:MAG: protein-glutamine glutaminase family protein [Pseudomonadota bacterium]
MPEPPLKTVAQSSEPLSFEQALALFDELSSIQKIPHAYLKDGCQHRATVMCDLMVRSGYAPMKAWMFNSETDLNLVSARGEEITWWFHVAPSLKVSLPKGGKEESLVFDPAMYDGPVTIKEWCRPIITSCPKATEVYLSEYNKCIKQQDKRDLEDLHGLRWENKVNAALKALGQYQHRQGDRAVFQSRLRQSFNDMARQRSKNLDPAVMKPHGRVHGTAFKR